MLALSIISTKVPLLAAMVVAAPLWTCADGADHLAIRLGSNGVPRLWPGGLACERDPDTTTVESSAPLVAGYHLEWRCANPRRANNGGADNVALVWAGSQALANELPDYGRVFVNIIEGSRQRTFTCRR